MPAVAAPPCPRCHNTNTILLESIRHAQTLFTPTSETIHVFRCLCGLAFTEIVKDEPPALSTATGPPSARGTSGNAHEH